ncbi:NucA/NucB deoxyribonuclease domain-containing protein [Rhodococcus sp. IEGM 1401]|uniref:NucA/NucB deoxyribonuclease domain-containing protein n=1 Tax=unclassified Rhodococcus (in: high G+C Gram-positive bacteria) TaxID=192944 RepID=UPI001FB1F0C4|nr:MULTISPECIES: NucA/NucB deoxyribonuclease domain-containing protein [unclassified Rhodococcus (in: high G+C Gram-positive bacteria)]MCJ0894379.1 NucA/NucB deoxyribonuclease domain-containing protein [Rhodococcus sp. ARC_M5]MCJ0980588.1 NucA/NucB deoxyribonuclease domain-containing protein [Rhodococcus sp. ARC_M12]MCZ4561871.1 NucA/NucB deoxyribonuclease domain-containing protein [Rhodococcus sp. IEGM 1401]MDI9921952.1 NucA/NucB deoxyribonuclease domain-containing protein [Rhodococcus sp. IEG
MTDPAEAAAIYNQVMQSRSTQAGPGARQAPPLDCRDTRFQSCKTYQATVTQYVQYNPPSGPLTPIGSWLTNIILHVRSPVQTPTKESVITMYANVVSTNPELTVPGIFEFELIALRGSGNTSQGWTPFRFPMAVGSTAFNQWEHYTQGNATSNTDVTTMRFDYQGNTPVPDLDEPRRTRTTNQKIRCDAATAVNYGTGCVNPSFIPTVTYTAARFPTITGTILDGQAAYESGIPGSGNPLVRGPSANNAANREAACPSSSLQRLNLLGDKPTDMDSPSCDEYPFASTEQGGYGSTVRWVPLAENTDQGTFMAEFYRTNRVMPGDGFYVNAQS